MLYFDYIVQCSLWNCILNFSVSDSYKIRSLTNDLFIAIIHHWKKCGIIIKGDSTWDISNSTPSSHLYNTIIRCLFELAIISCNEICEQDQIITRNEDNPQVLADSNRINLCYPMAEMFITLYLHAFPIFKTDQKIPDKELPAIAIESTQEIEFKVSIFHLKHGL